ncbi:MAG: protein kinase [Anaerolineae bacterium]|nr:protein kinase [Anaerolineae bacterium]
MRCPECGYPNREGAVACEHCRARLRLPCPRCGFGLDGDATACPRCGQSVVSGRPARSALGRELYVLAGRYQVLQQASRSRTSAVYRALDLQSGHTVAVKRLDLVALVTAEEKRTALANFLREVSALETLRHPGVVPILSHFRDKDSVGVVMPWIEGETLQEIYRRGPLLEPQVRALGAQLADAIAFLHSQEPPVLLRDLKPSHVMVTKRGDAILLDLGLSRHFRAGQSRGEANRGTPPFEAPEQAAEAYAGPESDIYALGTLLLLLARGPKDGRGAPDLSPTLRRALARARRQDPAKRYPSMAHLRRALAPADDAQPAAAPATAPSGDTVTPAPAPATPARPAAMPDITVVTRRLRIVRSPKRRQVGYRLRLRNNLQRVVTAQVRTAVPWLTPASDTIELDPDAEGSVLIRANLDQIPAHTSRVPRAVLVIAAGRHWVPAEVVEPAPELELDRQALDFGLVGPEGATQPITVSNAGGGQLSVHLSTAVPWLQVSTSDVRLEAGRSATVQVRLTPEAPEEGGTFTRALLVDSDAGQAYADVSFSRGRPELCVQPEALSFGAVRHPEAAQAELIVANPGSAPLTARIRSADDAITVITPEVTVPPRQWVRVSARLDTGSLKPGRLTLPSAIRITSPVGNRQLAAEVEVIRPLLAVADNDLDFGALGPHEVARAQLSLVLSNRGNEALTFRLVPQVVWIAARPAEGSLRPGSSTVVTVSLTEAATEQPGAHQASPALAVRSEGGNIGIAARYKLVKPVLEVEPASLDFGVIPEQGVSERHLTIANSGTGDLHWSATTDAPWVELSPSSGVCPEGETTSLTVRAYGLAVPSGTHQARALLTFHGPHNSRPVPATVAFSQPILAVEPVLSLPDSVDFAPVQGQLILFNRGVGELRAAVASSVPWVSVLDPEVSIASGRSETVAIAAQPPQDMHPGEVTLPGALFVSSNGGEAEVELRLRVVARPQIELTPDRLVLKPGMEGIIIVRNAGRATADGIAQASAAWLSVRPRQLTIRPGHRARLRVVAESPPAGQEIGAVVVVAIGEWRGEVEVVITE